jgi:hypothetical protein
MESTNGFAETLKLAIIAISVLANIMHNVFAPIGILTGFLCQSEQTNCYEYNNDAVHGNRSNSMLI